MFSLIYMQIRPDTVMLLRSHYCRNIFSSSTFKAHKHLSLTLKTNLLSWVIVALQKETF